MDAVNIIAAPTSTGYPKLFLLNRLQWQIWSANILSISNAHGAEAMAKTLMVAIIYAAISWILFTKGVTYKDWQFYAVIILATTSANLTRIKS